MGEASDPAPIVSLLHAIKRLVPSPLHPPLRRVKRALRALAPQRAPGYNDRVQAELDIYTATEQVHDLPAIAHYWSNTYLVPVLREFGFTNSIEMFRTYIADLCRRRPTETCFVLSVGCGDSASEINVAQWLIEYGLENFSFECLDINEEVLSRGKRSAEQKGYGDRFRFGVFDVNSWKPSRSYHVILAIQCLHHFVELEMLFDKIHGALHEEGFFLTDDMIGRNGHQRWPEALSVVHQLWAELPAEYTYNRALRRFEKKYENWDCSSESFEGIRAQDILPLLVQKFHFDLFVGFGNIIDIFIDRSFGPNFDPLRDWDRTFIDRVHALDAELIDKGVVKPTHMYAAMTKRPVASPRYPRHLTAQFCIRPPDVRMSRWTVWRNSFNSSSKSTN
jgi:SAM-dependent methyltransferase